MRAAIQFAMLALVLVVVAMVSALTAMRFAIHGQEVAVPRLVGITPAEAERAVAALGLQLSIERPPPTAAKCQVALSGSIG